jgi:hypothetical protein
MRFTSIIDHNVPLLAVDLGYSQRQKSCGIAHTQLSQAFACEFGQAIEYCVDLITHSGAHVLILEAVLSTYHNAAHNPEIRGTFEKGRGWYHGPGVSTFAAALRFLQELDRRLPKGVQCPIVEGFLSYKSVRSAHQVDAQRLVDEFELAERFMPKEGSERILPIMEAVPEVRRYNAPTTG